MQRFFTELFQKSLVEESRSTTIRPLGWIVALCAAIMLASFSVGAPSWAGVIFATLTVISVIAYLVSYFYLLGKDPDALRSERFTIQKLAIQKGLIGDDTVGMFAPEIDIEVKQVGTGAASISKGDSVNSSKE